MSLPTSTIIRSEDMGILQEASKVLEAANKRSADLEDVISAAMREAQERGYTQGKAQGLRDMELRLKETLGRAEAKLFDFEDRIINIVVRSIEKILGEMPEHERIRRSVKAAIADTVSATSLKIRVSPDDFEFVKSVLRDADPRLAVVADQHVGSRELLLEVDGQRQQIGLADQLANLLEAIHRG